MWYVPVRTHALFKRVVVFTVLTMTAGLVVPPLSRAATLDNNLIVSDREFFDARSMSSKRIQRWLESRGSFLAHYLVNDQGVETLASEFIAAISERYGFSPKFFLTLLQKEQGLVDNSSPSQYNLDYALGYGCPSTCSSAYKGFAVQFHAAATRIHDDYLPSLQQQGQFNGWGPGITKTTVDDVVVTPENIATAILYIYNPYVGRYGGGNDRYGANSLFRQLWLRWFVRKHPDGSLLQVKGNPGVWLIRNGQRSAFTSKAAFLANYDFSKVVTVDRDEIESYDIGPSINYPEPSILQVTSGGVYLVVNGMKRPFSSREVFRTLGYNPEELIRGVREEDLRHYPKGIPITEADIFPAGKLIKSTTTGGVAYIDAQGTRHPIFSKSIYRSQFKNLQPSATSDAQLYAYPVGEPIKFKDGELVSSRQERKIYFISDGERRAIPDLEVFRALGFKMKNVIWTDDRSITVHPQGPPLSDIGSAQP